MAAFSRSALKPENFAEMAKAGVGFVWSPRSNIELYGDTANVAAAHAAGVKMALAPDWSPTGSDGLLGELNYASVWNLTQPSPPFGDRDLVSMATSNAAELVGLGQRLGSLKAGYAADILVVRKPDSNANPADGYWTLTHSTPGDVQLVLIGGEALYGDAALMRQIAAGQLEPLDVCGAPKLLATGRRPFVETQKTLDRALRQFGRGLAPLAECSR